MVTTQRVRASALLIAATEVSIMATVVAVTLLYSPRLADNFLGKTALVHLLGGVTVLFWGLARAVEGSVILPRSAQWLPFFGFLAIMAIAGVTARNTMLVWETWLIWAQWLSLLLVVGDLSRDLSRARRLVVGVLGLSAIVSGIGLLQVVGYDVMSLPSIYRGAPLASLGNTNFVAHYLEVVLPLAVAVMVIGNWSPAIRAVAATGLALGSVLLVLAGSRGGWLGVGMGLIIMFSAVARPRVWGRRLLLATLIAGLLSPVAGFMLKSMPVAGGRSAADVIEEVADRSWERALSTFDTKNFSRTMRLLIWRDSMRIVRAQPWLGVGPGHFGLELTAHRTTTGQREWQALMGSRVNQPRHAHNEFIETWAEIGAFGAVALLWLLGTALYAGWRTGRHDRDRDGHVDVDRSLALGCLGGLVAAVVHALFSFNLRDPVSGTHVWILCGLVVGCASRMASEQRQWGLADAWRRAALVVVACLFALVGSYQGLCMLMGDVYFLESRHHLADGHGNRAIVALRKAVDWRESEFSYHHWLGQVSLQMKRYDDAARALTRSIELHDNNPGAIRLLATALLAQKHGDQVIAPLQHAIAIEPLVAENYNLLADALRQSGQPAEAVTARRQAISLRGDPRLLVALALDHNTAGHIDSAIAVLEQASRTSPRDAVIAGNLGALQIKVGESVAGEANLRRALVLEPGRAEWHGNLGLALSSQGRFVEALEVAQAAMRLEPGNAKWQELVRQLGALRP